MTSASLVLSISITAPSSSLKRAGRADDWSNGVATTERCPPFSDDVADDAEVIPPAILSNTTFMPLRPAMDISASVARRPPSPLSW